MGQYIVYLSCNNGSGYFTGISVSTNGREVKVHPYKQRAVGFETWSEAMSMAKRLKATFKCIYSYEVKTR